MSIEVCDPQCIYAQTQALRPGSVSVEVPADVWSELARSRKHFDQRFTNVWLTFIVDTDETRYDGLTSEKVSLIKEQFKQRREIHRTNASTLAVIERAEISDWLVDQGVPDTYLGRELEQRSKMPSEEERLDLLSKYRSLEQEAERRLAENLLEILTPVEQRNFLSFPARIDDFLVHPIGELYLGLNPSQKAAIEQKFNKLSEIREQRSITKKNSAEKKGLVVQVGMTSKEEISVRMQMLSLLSTEQLTTWLRLSGTIALNSSVSDWIDQLPAPEREIAAKHLRVQPKS